MDSRVHIVVFITAASMKEAELIAGKLLDSRKAACVSIIQAVKSLFLWEGRREESEETLLIVKSSSACLGDIETIVKENHSYEVPEIIAVPAAGGSRDYLDWIDESIVE